MPFSAKVCDQYDKSPAHEATHNTHQRSIHIRQPEDKETQSKRAVTHDVSMDSLEGSDECDSGKRVECNCSHEGSE